MKISSDLRAAVRSAEKTQPARGSSSWQVKCDADARAVEKFRNDPKNKKKIENALHKASLAMTNLANADQVLLELGLGRRHSHTGVKLEISDTDAFVKAGGDLAPEPAVAWRFDEVMARLAAAKTEEAGVAILAEYGINWV